MLPTTALHPVLAALRAHFPPETISWRTGPMTKDGRKTKPLAYIDARDVQDRLDAVLGLDWSSEFVPMPNGTACCKITIVVDGRAIWRSNGAELLPDKGDAAKPEQQEMAIKGSYSDAFKRAAVMFGVGQYLYGVDAPWVEVDERKQIKESEMLKLSALLRRIMPNAPKAAPAPKPVTAAGKPIAHNADGIVDETDPNYWADLEPSPPLPNEPYPDMGEVIQDNIPDFALPPAPPVATSPERSAVARRQVCDHLDRMRDAFTPDDMAAYMALSEALKPEMSEADWAAVLEHRAEWKAIRVRVSEVQKLKASNNVSSRSRGRSNSRSHQGAAA
jgi:hypothetical protein